MQDSERLSPGALGGIAKQVGRFLALSPAHFPSRKHVEIAESFPLWTLDPERLVEHQPRDLDALAEPLRRWYHQVVIDGEPRAYAISSESAPHRHTVMRVMRSPLPAKIDEAISWIDEHFPQASEVRLLDFAPSYVHAFWFAADPAHKQVVVVNAPSEVGLKQNSGIGETTFISHLADFCHRHPYGGLAPPAAVPVPLAGAAVASL